MVLTLSFHFNALSFEIVRIRWRKVYSVLVCRLEIWELKHCPGVDHAIGGCASLIVLLKVIEVVIVSSLGVNFACGFCGFVRIKVEQVIVRVFWPCSIHEGYICVLRVSLEELRRGKLVRVEWVLRECSLAVEGIDLHLLR